MRTLPQSRRMAVEEPEIPMNTVDTSAHLAEDGVAFTVTVDYQQRDCLISRDALSSLGRSVNENLDLLATYYAYHAKINGVARRLVAAGVMDKPVLLSTRNFD